MTTNPRHGRLLVIAPLVALLVACGGGGGGGGNDETSTDTDGTTGDVPGTTVTTSAGPTTTSATTTATVTTVGPSDTGTSQFPCCEARSEAGCSDDLEIAACVCEIDRFCCESVWDEVCAEKVVEFGCGVCEPGSTSVSTFTTSSDVTTGEPPDNVGACCSPHPETGCELPSISECVCNTEPSCCELEWDAFCVETVGTNGCGVCPPVDPTDTDTGPPPDNTESCCAVHESTGCEYEAIVDCVCAELPQCCSDAWSDSCIDAVGLFGCGVCPG